MKRAETSPTLPSAIYQCVQSDCKRRRRSILIAVLLLWRNEQTNPSAILFSRGLGFDTATWHENALWNFGDRKRSRRAQIKRAYPSLVKLCHPDLFVSGSAASAEAEKRMKQINMAYAVLSSPLTRRTYDRNLRVSEARYSELNPEHCVKCGPLTLYWHTERKIAPCEACRSVGR